MHMNMDNPPHTPFDENMDSAIDQLSQAVLQDLNNHERTNAEIIAQLPDDLETPRLLEPLLHAQQSRTQHQLRSTSFRIHHKAPPPRPHHRRNPQIP